MSFSLLVAYHVSIRRYIFIGFLHGATTAEAVLDSVGYYFGLEVIWEVAGKKEGRIMTEYIVGFRQGKRSEVLTIEGEDALIAALKVKHNHPEALISYVRKSNRRGDRRNPHRKE